ncbi:hypothetical protein KFE25_002175 [Diacronema lutheri]|uniref:Uncharacterized protein n=2 Tax=Diacronema lutheri TaxID=2081491 RepID=A0A8J6CBC4_DIALT|nr:hypothetical protein KFE25_002175 [Diacronema lutheri]
MQLVMLDALPPGYSVDTTKRSGFRINASWREAALYALAPGHNEFWNCLTDVLPLAFFAASAFALAATDAFATTPSELRLAIVWTIAGTCVQHLCSLVSHMFTTVSARLSHSIWFVDYAGIALNFVWNAPAMALVWRFDVFAAHYHAWFCVNVALSVLTLAASLRLAATHQPSHKAGAAGESWTATFFGQGLASALAISALLVPNLFFTAACGLHADGRALGVVLGLPFALTFKEAHLPEKLAADSGFFDCSFLHSHVIWHMLVWLLQFFYLLAYVRVVDGYGASAGTPLFAS